MEAKKTDRKEKIGWKGRATLSSELQCAQPGCERGERVYAWACGIKKL